MAKYPDRRSAAIPALHAAQEVHGWCSPRGDRRRSPPVMQLTPAYLTSVATFYDMFSTVPKPRNDVYVCTNISCSLLGADEFFEAMLAAAEGDPRRQRPLVRVPRRVRHRADGVGQRRVRRAARPRRRRSGSSRTCTPAGPCSSTSSSATAAAPIPAWPRRRRLRAARPRNDRDGRYCRARGPRATPRTGPGPTRAIEMTDRTARRAPGARQGHRRGRAPGRDRRTRSEAAVRPHRRAGAEHARGVRAPRRLRVAAQGAADDPRGGARAT